MGKQVLILASSANEGHPIVWEIFIYSGIVLAIIGFFIFLAIKGFKERVSRRLPTQIAEHLYFYIEGVCLSVIGPHGRKYIPFIMSIWIMIFVSNIVGLILPHTPTADWSLNLALSLICIGYVQYEGIRTNGLLGHLRHFAGPKLPFNFLIALTFGLFLFSIEIISEAMKIASLSLRLYSNIYGGHLVVDSLNNLVAEGQWPVGGLLFPLKLLAAIIQTLVFTMLTCMYLFLVTDHHDEESRERLVSLEEKELSEHLTKEIALAGKN